MESISSFNSEALRWFAIGTFVVNIVVGVTLEWVFETAPLSPFLKRLLPTIVVILILMTVACYSFGAWSLSQRKKLIEQIKAETKTEADGEVRPATK